MERANKEMPLYLQIAEWIRNDIKCGVIQPGEKLASEHDMMKKYGVSRMTVERFQRTGERGTCRDASWKGQLLQRNSSKEKH